jgi:bifunctional DNA-binding transcriptional regulator/antitoxin component of YhaV-PrlF toxin-antitoxin module
VGRKWDIILVRRLAQTKVDKKGRTQVPIVVRKITDLTKANDELVWWLYEEHIVLDKLGTGTPSPPKFREFVP